VTSVGRLGVLGGPFDPVHVGHLDAAAAAQAAFQLDHVVLMPSYQPPHRPAMPRAGSYHRFAMVALAISGTRGYRVSDIEIARGGASYTIDTLRRLHSLGWTPSQLFFIIGTDAFAEIATWREYPELLDAAHFVVIARPGTSLSAVHTHTSALQERVCESTAWDPRDARTRILLVEATTRDVSSTAIRARISDHQPIDDLVPAAVARHIIAHNLYGAADGLHGKDQSNGSPHFETRQDA